MNTDERWLNGWRRHGLTVLVGCSVHCAGCGKDFGIVTVAFDANLRLPEKLPDWPFSETDCPVHKTNIEPIRTRETRIAEVVHAAVAADRKYLTHRVTDPDGSIVEIKFQNYEQLLRYVGLVKKDGPIECAAAVTLPGGAGQ